jgi:quinohemoprotein amine dehydrogenase
VRTGFAAFALCGVTAAQIPVKDATVVSKCGTCHARDEAGNMERVSWERTTPEGWQDVVKRMAVVQGAQLTPDDARSIVRYLASSHGLAPEEAQPVMYDAERRFHEETLSNDSLRKTCTGCHSSARALSWRRSPDEWKKFAAAHAASHKFPVEDDVVDYLAKIAPLSTPEWTAWTNRKPVSIEGRWLLTASLAGRGRFTGEMRIDPAGDSEFNYTVRLVSVRDGSTLLRSGHSAVYGDYSWRGRSRGRGQNVTAPDDPLSETREVMWFAPGRTRAEGRWFWGQYQEFGFEIQMMRPAAGATLLLAEPVALKTGARGARIRVLGDNLPVDGDVTFGPGVTVTRVVSRAPGELVAEVNVAPDPPMGRRDVAIGPNRLTDGLAIYDRVDYLKVIPDSAMAAFSDPNNPRVYRQGYQQFDAVGFHRGADGRALTDDDVALGPVDVTWSTEVFYALKDSDSGKVGHISQNGLFTPADVNPEANFDVWAVATARSEEDKNGKPLVGKSYLVVTVPWYTFNGRRYVRNLDRWVDDGPATGRQ